MTKHERLKAFEMRLDGSSWSKIGRELGYTSATIHKDLLGCVMTKPRQVNLMTVSLPGEDKYNAQSAFVGQLVDFAHETSSHVHLVAHRRKGGTQKGSKGDSDDVSGSADITNRADNTFAVSRIEDEDSPFDAALEILANRAYGVTGIINLKFDIRSRRYYQGNVNWLCGWESEANADSQVQFTELTGDDADNPFIGE